MDQTKWKSVVLPRDVYEEVKLISELEGPNISRQLRFIVDDWKEEFLTPKDLERIEAHKLKVQEEMGAHPTSFST